MLGFALGEGTPGRWGRAMVLFPYAFYYATAIGTSKGLLLRKPDSLGVATGQ